MRPYFVIGLFLLEVCSATVASADPTDYKINFTLAAGAPLPTAGAFQYDSSTQTFSDFTVTWFGNVFDLTSSANAPSLSGTVPCLSGLSGAAASFLFLDGACDSASGFTTEWEGDGALESGFLFNTFDVHSDGLEIFTPASMVLITGPAAGQWTITAVPEPSALFPVILVSTLLFCWKTDHRTKEANILTRQVQCAASRINEIGLDATRTSAPPDAAGP